MPTDNLILTISLVVLGIFLLVAIIRGVAKGRHTRAIGEQNNRARAAGQLLHQEIAKVEELIAKLKTHMSTLPDRQQAALLPACKVIDTHFDHLQGNAGTLEKAFVLEELGDIETAIDFLMAEITELTGESGGKA